jgi:transcriptional regulator with XRE-family HTH domain
VKDTTIGTEIRKLRQRRGWTQEELAARADLSREVVAKIELGGTARMETYHAIARALGVRTLMFVSPQDPEPVADPHRDTALAQIRAVINPPVSIDGGLIFPAVEDAEPTPEAPTTSWRRCYPPWCSRPTSTSRPWTDTRGGGPTGCAPTSSSPRAGG